MQRLLRKGYAGGDGLDIGEALSPRDFLCAHFGLTYALTYELDLFTKRANFIGQANFRLFLFRQIDSNFTSPRN